MKNARLSLTAAATVVLSSSLLFAQAAPADATQKPSPYQGVAQPPAADVIDTTPQPVAEATAQATAPATPQQPAPAAQKAPTPAPAANDNPDAGIIETPLPASTPEYRPHAAAKLQGRIADDDANDNKAGGIVTYVPAPANALPSGTIFKVKMLEDVDAARTPANAPFRARLAEDLLRNGKVVVPVGSELRGHIVLASAGNRLKGGSVLHLRPDEFVLPDGTRYHLRAQVIDTFGSDTKPRGEGDIVARQHPKRQIAELGISTGSGAIVGAAVGGGVGAVVGTAVGAGVGTAHWFLTNWSANLPESSTVVFSMTEPMILDAVQDQKTELLPQTF